MLQVIGERPIHSLRTVHQPKPLSIVRLNIAGVARAVELVQGSLVIDEN